LSAAETSIPYESNRHTSARRIPGWSERIEPLREKSLFWHGIWVDCGRAKTGAVADCMRRTRAVYIIRQVKKEEDAIVRERIAEALTEDPTRNLATNYPNLSPNAHQELVRVVPIIILLHRFYFRIQNTV
jgi:hypothetical protein